MDTAPAEGQETYAIGLDVGGTKIAGGIVALETGHILIRREVPTYPTRGGEAVLSTTLTMAGELLAEARTEGVEPVGMGVGVCELVSPQGIVTSAQTVEWRDVPVQERLSQLAPAVVESDVRAAALAEARYGVGRDFDIFAYITVGTGISSCLLQYGRPYAGARGNAIVLATGHLTTICNQCSTKTRTVIEEIASGPALVARYNEESGRTATTGQEVMEAVKAGDPIAEKVVCTGGESLGVAVGWLANVLDPEAIVVGGGLGLAGGLYWSSFVAACREHIWSDATRRLPILQAQLGPDAGLVGAAAAILRQ